MAKASPTFVSINFANGNGRILNSVFAKRPMIMTPIVTVAVLVLATLGDVTQIETLLFESHLQEVTKASTTFASINFAKVNGYPLNSVFTERPMIMMPIVTVAVLVALEPLLFQLHHPRGTQCQSNLCISKLC